MPSPALKATLFDDVYVREEDVTDELKDLLDTMKIDPNNLAEEASDHAAFFSRWAVLRAEAAGNARFLKRRLDLRRAEADGEVRSSLDISGEKITEAKVQTGIDQTSEVIKYTEDLTDAERVSDILNAVCQALVHRREMIAELLRDKRHEWSAAERSI